MWYLYQGVKFGIYPPLIFLGIGCMTDFGPLISNPKSFSARCGRAARYFRHLLRCPRHRRFAFCRRTGNRISKR